MRVYASRDGVRATQVSELREEVRAALTASVEPLKAYLATYETYLEFLRLDVDAYVAQAEDDYGGPPPGALAASLHAIFMNRLHTQACPRTSATS